MPYGRKYAQCMMNVACLFAKWQAYVLVASCQDGFDQSTGVRCMAVFLLGSRGGGTILVSSACCSLGRFWAGYLLYHSLTASRRGGMTHFG